MSTCVIFCAGGFTALAEPLKKEDCILAADGGLTHLEKLGIVPDGILGDFDSLGYVPEKGRVFPVEKDDTDTMLAIRQGLEQGLRRFVIYGGVDGPRLDHTLANFQALQFLADNGAQGWLIGERIIATVLKNGVLSFGPEARGILSVFCMGPEARGVTLRGVKYPLEEGCLTSGLPLGVSNQFLGRAAQLQVRHGSLLVLFDRENGIPSPSPEG